jgi:hypothetical protein
MPICGICRLTGILIKMQSAEVNEAETYWEKLTYEKKMGE